VGVIVCGLDDSYLWARAMPAPEFLERSERGLLAGPPPSPSRTDVHRSPRKPVELPLEGVCDSARAALSDDEADDHATDHEINKPAQFILDNLACVAKVWGPTARARSCHCRT
jgi:hypothetical protein